MRSIDKTNQKLNGCRDIGRRSFK